MWDGNAVYLARIESGLSQLALAEVLGIDEGDVYLAEREQPPDHVSAAIADWMAQQ